MTSARRDPDGVEAAPDVRERILRSALEILHESGLRRLTQVQVARRAGIRQSHLTYYFPTRQDLLEGVTARFVERITRGARRAIDGETADGDDSMLARLAATVADVEHTRMFLGVIVEADRDPALRAMLTRSVGQVEAALEESLGEGRAGQARFVLTALWGLALRRFVLRPSPDGESPEAYLAWIAGALAEGESPA